MLPYLPDSGGAVFLRAKFQIFRRKRNLWRGRSKASHCLNSYFGAPPNGKRSKLLISRSRGVRGREGQKWGEEGEAERWEGWWLLGFGIWDLGPGKSTSSECHYNPRPIYWAYSDCPSGNAKGHISMEISGNIEQNHVCFL